MLPALDGGDDAVRVGGPDERLRVAVGFGDEAMNGSLQLDDRNTPRFRRRRVSLAKKPSTALSHEAEVGV